MRTVILLQPAVVDMGVSDVSWQFAILRHGGNPLGVSHACDNGCSGVPAAHILG